MQASLAKASHTPLTDTGNRVTSAYPLDDDLCHLARENQNQIFESLQLIFGPIQSKAPTQEEQREFSASSL